MLARHLPSPTNPFEYLAVLVSGWINPVFLIATVLALSPRRQGLARAFRTIVVVMIPFCWIVFYCDSVYPREGYFLWTAGMLVVLFADRLADDAEASTRTTPG
jgi:hypothetical protein